jgi:hypothetical protein
MYHKTLRYLTILAMSRSPPIVHKSQGLPRNQSESACLRTSVTICTLRGREAKPEPVGTDGRKGRKKHGDAVSALFEGEILWCRNCNRSSLKEQHIYVREQRTVQAR